MGLIGKYNEVSAGIKIQDQEYTTYMNSENIVGREEAIQTQPYTTKATTTLTYPIIMTGVTLFCQCADSGGASNATASIRVNGFIIGTLSLDGDNSSGLADSIYIPVPNWYLDTGSLIEVFTGGSDGNGDVCLIGYKA